MTKQKLNDLWKKLNSDDINLNILCITDSETPKEFIRFYRNTNNPEIIKALETKKHFFSDLEWLKINNNTKKLQNFCPLPWLHSEITTNGSYRVCCQMIKKPYGFVEKNRKQLTVFNSSIKNVLNSDTHKEIRKSFLKDEKHSLCNLCWDEESKNIPSKRQGLRNVYKDIEKNLIDNTNLDGSLKNSNSIKYLDLRFGNKCNLKCTSCGPTESDQWYSVAYEMGRKQINYFDTGKIYSLDKEEKNGTLKSVYNLNTSDFDWPDTSNFVQDFKELDVDRIYFTGGEPSINEKHYEILDYLIETDKCKNITLEYNTNAISITKKFLDKIINFKTVILTLSIDALEEKFYYLRYPGKWELVNRSVKILKEYNSNCKNLFVNVTPTISIFNIDSINLIQDWINNKMEAIIPINLHILEGPDWMHLGLLGQKSRKKMQLHYENLSNNATNEVIKNNYKNLVNIIEKSRIIDKQVFIDGVYKIDNARTIDYRNYFPDLDNLFI